MVHLEFDFSEPTVKTNNRVQECKCDKCGHVRRTYTRSVNSNMAIAAIMLYRYGKGEYVKVEDLLLSKGHKRCGDFSYLRFYNIIESLKEFRADGSDRNGKYRLTGYGSMWVEGKVKIKERFVICENKLLNFEGNEVDIHHSLKEKFSYTQLMNG